MAADRRAKALGILKTFYGYSAFRPGQWEVIDAATSGRDVLVIMPTGGGKSMCYQLPALMAEGCAVVVSPLIALMEDQTAALLANNIPAAAIHSGHDEADNRRAIEAALAGKLKLIYVSPERLLADFDTWVTRLPLSLVAIDEAHCISQWGHDFRPVYTQLAAIKQRLPSVPVMALTATADRDTRSDIAAQLGLVNPLMWLGSFNRPNLSLTVIHAADKARRIATVERLIKQFPSDTGIVYTLSREGAEKFAETLIRKGYRVAVYHAGMDADERERSRRAFSDGDVQAVCATIAFGMGIDKSNIRWVVHNNIPGTIESYYQEIGRAGRDGLPSRTILFHSLQDLIMRRKFAEESGRSLVALDKLQRIKDYAEATVCRRRVLLSYFGEAMDRDCGNCDVCLNPPERIDGTILVQKAASAILRTGSQVGQMMLIDILRGSARGDLIAKGYNTIKTYGAGRDLPAAAWRHYILQMVQLGLLDVSLADGNLLSVTPYGMKAVRGETTVELSLYRPEDYLPREKKKTRSAPEIPGITDPDKLLFEQLKTVRREVARNEGVPPYMVFSDATLLDMASRRPSTFDKMLDVSGVGRYKATRFGHIFLKAIKDWNNGR